MSRFPVRHRLTALAGILTLCAAGLVSGLASAAAATVSATAAPSAARVAQLYVSDYTDNTVLKVGTDGSGQSTVPTTGLTRPTGLALDDDSNLYISDTGNNRVVTVPADGSGQATVPATGLSRPIGLALGKADESDDGVEGEEGDDELFIADSFNNRVVRLPLNGGPQTTVPATGLLHPDGLAFDARRNLYIADLVNDRVVVVPADGGPQRTVPTAGLSEPTGLAFDRAGNLYVADSGNDRVVRLPRGGGPQTTVPATGLNTPQGLAVDAYGNLFVADFGNDRVVEIPADGSGQLTVPIAGLHSPVGLAIPPIHPAPTRLTASAATVERHTSPASLRVKGLSATLTSTTDGAALPGQTVTFTDITGAHKLCAAVTNSRGRARCDATLRTSSRTRYDDLRHQGYRATYAGTAPYRPSSTIGHLRAARRS
ncbi:hypothetical protein ACH4TX_09780 [Streptomyces sp. NPDC021098]|uniref:hypothetical protein n=1 Tax=unclassified Streptomyces TaxID=2593676 RepID=UPI00379B1B9E